MFTTRGRWYRSYSLGWMVLWMTLFGCSGPSIELAPVHGTITIDDAPMPEGKVMFAPVAQGERRNVGKPASSRVGPDGRYRLTTYRKNDGAVVGEHWVTIINSDESDELPEFARFLIRQKYQVIAGQDNQIDIQLTRKEIARFGQDDN